MGDASGRRETLLVAAASKADCAAEGHLFLQRDLQYALPPYSEGLPLFGSVVNGMRTWSQRDGGMWIFSTINGGWMVGDKHAVDNATKKSRGLVASLCGHNGEDMPHELVGDWKWVDEDGNWHVEAKIKLTVAPSSAWRRV
eukprot:TRINITY_DN24006_c0_g1_i3.p1 TRINITY_DN24006_c0_g1~~TRINITY_DN24006_c0_g1_i3.p1  ORF type:complete len:141 (+),score=20.58 TRINITY_DN24006_c0_g1_i3:257-679(+)